MRTLQTAMTRAVHNSEWERIALYLALAVAATARVTPQATIDDVLALLNSARDGSEEGTDDAARR